MRRVWLMVLMALSLAACSDSTGPQNQIVGTYTLLTINGVGMPYPLVVLPANIFRLDQTSGRFTLNSNRTYEEMAVLREQQNDSLGNTIVAIDTVRLTGTWEAEDSVLLVTQSGSGAVGFGYVSRNRLTLSFEVQGDLLLTYIYQRN
jgi:hypothetical protein